MSVSGSNHPSSGATSSGGPRGDAAAIRPRDVVRESAAETRRPVEAPPRSVVEKRSPAPPVPAASPSRKLSIFKGLSLSRSGRRATSGPLSDPLSGTNSSHPNDRTRPDSLSLSHSISNSAPTILRSAMSCRTLDASLGRAAGAGEGAARVEGAATTRRRQSVAFAQVNIREYERILSDNPCVSSGPPIGIGWRHAPEALVVDVDDCEASKPSPRQRSEYLVPKHVREGLIQEHAGVGRREIAGAVRSIQKAKAQRRRTVINLGYQPAQERIEGARRKVKKILRPSRSSNALQARLWDEAHVAAMEKARRLEDSMRNGESVSMRNVYSVGNPCDNVLPSRRNSSADLLGSDARRVWQPRRVSLPATLATTEGGEGAPADAAAPPPGATSQPPPPPAEPVPAAPPGEMGLHRSKSDGALVLEGQGPVMPEGYLRHSAHIMASEIEVDEILATLLLDGAREGGIVTQPGSPRRALGDCHARTEFP